MDSIVTLLKIFPFNPVAALTLSGMFAYGAYRKGRKSKQKKTLIVTAASWALYALWEMYMLNWRSPTGDRAIRVDLVFIMPLLLVSAAAGINALFQGSKSTVPDN